jgi:hypothetical protein
LIDMSINKKLFSILTDYTESSQSGVWIHLLHGFVIAHGAFDISDGW